MSMTQNQENNRKNKPKRIIEDYSEMADARIITKNLVYVIGLSSKLANKDILLKREYFGQYGTILKVVVNKNKAYNQNNPKGPSYSAYITYLKPFEASIAILNLDNIIIDDHLIRASYGTTKYCTFYLRQIECTNKDCLFLHQTADDDDIISRDDLNSNKNIFIEQQLYAIRTADLYNTDVKERLMNGKKIKTVFPSSDNVYNKEIVKANDPSYLKQKVLKKIFVEDASSAAITPQVINDVNTNDKKSNTSHIETASTSSKGEVNGFGSSNEEKLIKNLEKNINENENIVKNNFYKNKQYSRFSFTNCKLKQDDSISIPTFVSSLIYKQIALRRFANNNIFGEEIFYSDKNLNVEYTNNNPWAEFIINNKDEHINKSRLDKEFIDDFDYINQLVLDKISNKRGIL